MASEGNNAPTSPSGKSAVGSPFVVVLTGKNRKMLFRIVSSLLAVLLLVAAALKAVELVERPLDGRHILSLHVQTALVIEVELAVALLLLLGLRPRVTTVVAALLFSGFACVSAYKVLAGDVSCGCLGRLAVPPEYSLLGDVVAVAALTGSRIPFSGTLNRDRMFGLRSLGFVCGMCSGTAALIWSMMLWAPASRLDGSASVIGSEIRTREFMELNPDDWIGQPFPLREFIDIGKQLSDGKWVAVLFRENCDECSRLLAEYDRLGNQVFAVTNDYHVAAVRVDSGTGDETSERDSGHTGAESLLGGTLDRSKRWVVETPTVLVIEDGIVRRVTAKNVALRR